MAAELEDRIGALLPSALRERLRSDPHAQAVFARHLAEVERDVEHVARQALHKIVQEDQYRCGRRLQCIVMS
eukprot:SAG11_NODE_16028_length_559_cov_0.532609_1_plen_72_part_00